MKLRHPKLGTGLLAPLILCLFSSFSPGKSLPVRIYTSADGLGSSFVNYLVRDSRGFMWFCTRDGLSRFDGSRFVTYQIGEQNSQPGVENIFEASDGSYWITTTAGTYRFDPTRITIQDPNLPTLRAEHVFNDRGSIYEDSNGNLWLGADGLSKIERVDGKWVARNVDLGISVPPGSVLSVISMREAPDGSLWIVTSAGHIRQLPGGQRILYRDPELTMAPGGSLRILPDRRGFAWIAIMNRLFVTRPERPESFQTQDQLIVRDFVPTRTIDLTAGMRVPFPERDGEIFEFRNPNVIDNRFTKELLQASDDSVWISGEDTLLEFSGETVNIHTSADGLPSVMGDLAEDGAGNIWIAGQSSLARLNRDGLVSFGKVDGTGSDRILGVFRGKDGSIHVSTSDSNIAVFDGRRFSSVRPGIAENTAHLWTSRTAIQDSRGDFWILTSQKLFRFSGASTLDQLAGRTPSATYTSADGLQSDGMFQIFEDSRGNIWLSNRGTDASQNGLSILRPGEQKFTPFTEQSGMPPRKSHSSFAEDRNGNVWVGVFEGGVLRYDGTRFHALEMRDGVPESSLVTDIHFDARGDLWITSASSGVTRVSNPLSDRPTFFQYTNTNGLSSNNVRTVSEDRFGRIYFGTARGVDRLTPETGSVRQFTVADGLPADFVSDSNRDSEGNIWFATNSGVARLSPVADETTTTPKVWLGAMRVGGNVHPMSDLGAADIGIDDLAHWQNNLEIEYFGIDFHAGEALRYQYKLEGADTDWSRPDTDRSVTFANLRPGSYRFLVRSVSSAGIASEQPAMVTFTILSPIWQRWWFVLICAAVVAAIIISLYRYRIANLRRVNLALSEAKVAEEGLRRSREERLAELEQVRSRIATDLHDDIGSSLTQIAVLSEVAQARAHASNGHLEMLQKITDVSNELVGTMSDIVWSINPSKDHLSDLTQRMRRVAADLLSPRDIVVHFTSSEENRAYTIKTNARREVFLIFKESINNIAKHSGAKNVYIDLDIEHDLLLLKIRDDGAGFEHGPPSFEDTFSSEGPAGNGLRNMRKRAAEMGGRFDIDSAPGRGTTTFLSLPLEAGHTADS